MTTFTSTAYFETLFDKLVYDEPQVVSSIAFHNCRFKQCKLANFVFKNCTFEECDFEGCDLSLVKLTGCKFSEVSFKNSKLVGVNWTEISWPLVKLTSPIYFHSCNISHSSFYGLLLIDLVIEDCKAHDVDFREANLSHASFMDTDLHNSQFINTTLKQANFTNAIGYQIDMNQNNITKAIFSFPEVIALLKYQNIVINGYE